MPYVSSWLYRSQENQNKPPPLVLNKPANIRKNRNTRTVFTPVRPRPKTRKLRKNRKSKRV
jgi:hypothetical protein